MPHRFKKQRIYEINMLKDIFWWITSPSDEFPGFRWEKKLLVATQEGLHQYSNIYISIKIKST